MHKTHNPSHTVDDSVKQGATSDTEMDDKMVSSVAHEEQQHHHTAIMFPDSEPHRVHRVSVSTLSLP